MHKLLPRAVLVSVLVALGLGAGFASAQGRRVERNVESTTQVVNGVRTVTTITTTRITENGRTETHVETATRTEGSAPPAPPSPPPRPGNAPPSPPPPGLASAALEAHNRARASQTGAALPPLQWNDALAARARDWAHTLCGGGAGFQGLRHRPPEANGPGENLAMQGSSEPDAYPVQGAVGQWMSEERFYNRSQNRCEGGECGHYTQVVWRNTTAVGCGTARCPMNGGMTASVWVCNYSPPGNWQGQRPY